MAEASERIALRDGDLAALREVFDRYHDSMSLVLRSLAADEDELDGLLRSVWVAAIADRVNVPDRGSPRAWLFSFVLRCFDVDSPAVADGGDDPFVPAGRPWADHWDVLPDPWPDGTESWLRSPAGRSTVLEFLASSAFPDRLLLVLRDLDGWSPEEVAALTGWSPQVQREVLARARTALHTAIRAAVR